MADFPSRITTVNALERTASGIRDIKREATSRAAARSVEAAWADWRYLADVGGYLAPNVTEGAGSGRVAILRDRWGFITLSGTVSHALGDWIAASWPTKSLILTLPESLRPETYIVQGAKGDIVHQVTISIDPVTGEMSLQQPRPAGANSNSATLNAIRYRAANAGEGLRE